MKNTCAICEGLSHCLTCGAWEGELTSECCGEKIDEKRLQRIMDKSLDFKGGKWLKKDY